MSNNNIHFFTIASHHNHHLDRLLASANQHSIDLKVLGLGEKYFGHGTKRVMLTNELKTYDPDDLFLFVDAYDVIFLTGKDEIIEKYNAHYKDKLVYGAEQNFGMYSFDDIYYYLKYPIKEAGYRFLNTGTIIGKIGDALNIFHSIGLEKSKRSDQMDTIRYFTKHPSQMTVDQSHELFAVNGGRAGLECQDYEIKQNRIFSTKTNTWPILFHVPGKFFIGLDNIAHQLGYMKTIPNYTKQEIKWLQSSKRDHIICDRLGIDNYKWRLLKNWTINGLILGVIICILMVIK